MTYDSLMNSEDSNQLTNRYTLKEEIFNGITHGIGALSSIVALVVLVAFASINGDALQIVSFSIYGFTLFFLFTSSTLYHSIFHEKSKKVFRVLDHASIYLVIAGSYTPIALLAMDGVWGWTVLISVWSVAILGIVLKALKLNKSKRSSALPYILMSWLAVIAIIPMLNTLPSGLLVWLFIGGVIYTLGVVFYVCKKIPFNHGIWHIFVLAGATVHYLGILFHLAL